MTQARVVFQMCACVRQRRECALLLKKSDQYLVLRSSEDDQFEPASFLISKILPLGKTEALNDTHNA